MEALPLPAACCTTTRRRRILSTGSRTRPRQSKSRPPGTGSPQRGSGLGGDYPDPRFKAPTCRYALMSLTNYSHLEAATASDSLGKDRTMRERLRSPADFPAYLPLFRRLSRSICCCRFSKCRLTCRDSNMLLSSVTGLTRPLMSWRCSAQWAVRSSMELMSVPEFSGEALI